MFLLHQIVNVLINPALVVLALLALGWALVRGGRARLGKGVCVFSGATFFLMCWPPLVDSLGIWLERDYPAMEAEVCPDADAIIVLGGGVGGVPPGVDYPYPLMSDAADRVWHGARLWRVLKVRNPEKMVKVYCTGPDVSLTTPPLLRDFGIPEECIVAIDGPHNTEEEARTLWEVFAVKNAKGAKALLVTSALHMRRAVRIFEKYAPDLEVTPIATDHHFVANSARFRRWQYWFPNIDALAGFSAIEHELVGLLRYTW